MSIEFIEPTAFSQDIMSFFSCIPEKKGHTCVYVDSQKYKADSRFKIFVHQEPNAIFDNEEFLLQNHKNYDIILTYNKRILETCKNAIYCLFPAWSWISEYYWYNINIQKKKFQISCLTGFKRMTEGHIFRHLLYFNQEIFLQYPIVFFRSGEKHILPDISNNPILGNDKFALFEEFQFTIVVENSSQPNYFTEKLIDCLITKTIPIYYGCPNIDEYFDTKGWILLDSVDPVARLHELYSALSSLDEMTYSNYKSTIEHNYQICIEKYRTMGSHIQNALQKV
jgi:hypothetical protein